MKVLLDVRLVDICSSCRLYALTTINGFATSGHRSKWLPRERWHIIFTKRGG